MIKTTRWWPDTCGCAIDYDWDTNDNADVRVHTFKSVHKKCTPHAGKLDSELFATLTDENNRKNDFLVLTAETIPALADPNTIVDTSKVSWSFNGARVLVISIPSLNATQKSNLQSAVDARFGAGKVTIV